MTNSTQAEVPAGGQDRKFAFLDGQYVNRVSGEPIPHDEPIIIFRARDHHALPLLREYLSMATDAKHQRAIKDRMAEFGAYARAHPERMKEPGITGDIRLNDEATPSTSVQGAGEAGEGSAGTLRRDAPPVDLVDTYAKIFVAAAGLDWAKMPHSNFDKSAVVGVVTHLGALNGARAILALSTPPEPASVAHKRLAERLLLEAKEAEAHAAGMGSGYPERYALRAIRLALAFAARPAGEGETRLRGAMEQALRCTPTISTGSDGFDEPHIVYDCGDPWEILRAALAPEGTPS